jgi:hypothetical protein
MMRAVLSAWMLFLSCVPLSIAYADGTAPLVLHDRRPRR